MLKLLKFLFVLALLAAIALAVLHWFFPEQEIPFFAPTYPDEMVQLEMEVGIDKNDLGFTVVNANLTADLFFMQGYHHGREHGQKLDYLRRLFKGERIPQMPTEITGLAELFYYLDLDDVARLSLELYPPQLQVILTQYAKGITIGGKLEVPWSTQDVLLLQRSYAFLMGRNFIKEWCVQKILTRFRLEEFQNCSAYPVGDFGALNHNLILDGNLNVLLDKPLLETVRLFDKKKGLAFHTRAHPYLAFIFEPMILELNGSYEARGLALVGLPFLWLGQNDHLVFGRQTILANDEQFFSVPPSALLAAGNRFIPNKNAKNAGRYDEPPVHATIGRKMDTVVSGKSGEIYFYYWDGLRPSADLTALYYLLEASSLDQALVAYQYHQVPASELTLVTKNGHVANMLTYPSDPRQGHDTSGLFLGPYTRIGRRVPTVTSTHFRGDAAWRTQDAGEIANSELDQKIVALMRFYLQGPISGSQMERAKQKQLLDLLSSSNSDRDYFIQMLWQLFFELLQEEHFDEASRPATKGFSLECQQLVLNLYGRDARQDGRDFTAQRDRTKLITQILEATWKQWKKRASSPKFLVPNSKGKIKPLNLNLAVRSADAATAPFFVDDVNRVTQVATHTFIWNPDFTFWHYDYVKKGEFNEPTCVRSPSSSGLDTHYIKPKL